ncbi:MAG: class I SAM-dependent methyltransferase [Gemmatimonadota bacterium]
MTTQKTTPSPDEIRDAWDRIAEGFDRLATPLTMDMGEEAIRRVGLRPDMTFLDVAAGSGALSIPAARLGARVVATDLAPGMIARLEARARDEGLSNLEARVMDGCALDLEDDSFDVSGSLNGVSLFPDLDRGLEEMVRVTRPGGRVMIAAFGPMSEVEFLTFFLSAMRATVPDFEGPPMDPPPPPFQVAEPAELHRRLAGAGLEDIRVETVAWEMTFRSGRHLWDMVTSSNPIGAAIVAKLTDVQRETVRDVLDGMLRERAGGASAAILTNGVNVGVGTA